MNLRDKFEQTKLNEYNHIRQEILNIIKSNELMLKYTCNQRDYDIEMYRKENIIYLNEYIDKLNKIKEEMKSFNPNHPILNEDFQEFKEETDKIKIDITEEEVIIPLINQIEL